jgi:DNA invertase Pin-like site-specific DNA recombinase
MKKAEQRSDTERHVALYVRVSTGHQAEDGVSLDAQEKSLRAWADREFTDTRVAVYREAGASAYSGKRRPEYERLLSAVREGKVSTIAAAKPDRLNRSVADGIELRKACADADTRIYTQSGGWVETNAFGDFSIVMLNAVAQLESAIRSERVRDANDYLRSQGYFVGSDPPWGYQRDGRELVFGADHHLIRRAFELYDSGSTKAQIVRWLNASPREERLDPVKQYHVARILTNPVYAGWIVAETKSGAPVRLPGRHTPIVAPDLFEAVQKRLDTHKGHGYHGDRLLPFAGLTRCGSCQAPLRHHQAKGGYHYVTCSKNCGLKAWPASNFEMTVVLHIDALIGWINTALADGSWRALYEHSNAAQLAEELENARSHRDDLIRLGRKRALDVSELETELKASRSQLIRLEESYAIASRSEAEAESELSAFIEPLPKNFTRWWVETDPEERERVLPSIVRRIWLHEHGIGFMPDRCFPRPLLFRVETERGRPLEASPTVALGFAGIKRIGDAEVALKVRSARRGRWAGRSRSPPCGAPPERG